ncbi:hypothetical protein HC031_09025 [Planosporangium thailandense]|uniref:Lipoprotein n=1 Tax=Planosporangium thailandense TaxID=765197 RepID=A0ABX0XXG8_9ACTN|nr:hypothetical protein [Planosporangium thailandense]NJC69859.1 hypothetical protein [Planosporangium thailandense]
MKSPACLPAAQDCVIDSGVAVQSPACDEFDAVTAITVALLVVACGVADDADGELPAGLSPATGTASADTTCALGMLTAPGTGVVCWQAGFSGVVSTHPGKVTNCSRAA